MATSALFIAATAYLVIAIVTPQDDLEKRLALLDARHSATASSRMHSSAPPIS
jgi:hypothetical protein